MIDFLLCKDPIFVVGMNGSGTTMLLDCLNNHSEIYGFRREAKFIPYYHNTIHTYGDLKNDDKFLNLLNAVRNEPVIKIVNDNKPAPLPPNWKNFERSLATALNSVFSYFSLSHSKSRWCIKAPFYALHILDIGALFPASKFIHIIRDGRDCAASLHRRWQYSPPAMIYRWKQMVKEGQRQGSILGPDRYLEIFYEDFISDPVRWMQKVSSFLNIEYEKSVTETSRIRIFTGTETKEIQPHSNRYKKYFDSKAIKRLEKISGRQLQALGYHPLFLASDYDPPKLLINYLTYYGYLRDRIFYFRARVKRGESAHLQISSQINKIRNDLVDKIGSSIR